MQTDPRTPFRWSPIPAVVRQALHPNGLVCPTALKRAFGRKRQFPELSNLAPQAAADAAIAAFKPPAGPSRYGLLSQTVNLKPRQRSTVRCRKILPLAAFGKFLCKRLPMAKFKVRAHRERITVEVNRDLRQEIARWAVSERRTVSNLLRGVLSDVVNERIARGAAARGPIQKQLTA